MTTQEHLKLQIYDAYYESQITEEEKDYLFTVSENVIGDMIRKIDFKKRYKYDSKKKTIIVDGEEFKVDLDVKSPTVVVKDMLGNKVTTVRQTSSTAYGVDKEDAFVIIDKDFFKIKGKSKREAFLQHEIGHLKMHSLNTRSDKLDKRFISEDEYNRSTKDVPDMIFDIKDGKIKLNPKDEVFRKDEYIGSRKGTKEELEERDKIRKAAKKYEDEKCYHANAAEFEADRYAANRVSEEDLMDAIKQLYKGQLKDLTIIKQWIMLMGKLPTREQLKNIKVQQKEASDRDFNARKKALEDKVLRDAKILKRQKEEKNKK